MFTKLDKYNIEFDTFGTGRGKVTVFRDPECTAQTPWQATHEGTILIVGGAATIQQMRLMWSENSRPEIQKLVPMANSTHAKIRDWLDSPSAPKRIVHS